MNEAQYHRDNTTFSEKNSYEKVRRLFDFKSGVRMRVLDVGCGNRRLADFLAGLGHEVVGLDIQTVQESSFDPVTFIKQDIASEWQVPQHFFDVVICTDVAEHLYDPTHILRQSEKALKDNGVLLFGVPNHFDLRQRLRMVFGKGIIHWDNVRYEYKPWNYAHVRFFTLSELLGMFQACGWQVDRVQLNFMGGGLVPTRFTPTAVRYLLLRLWPNLFSGKFIVTAKKTGRGSFPIPKKRFIPYTPKDF